MFVIGDVHGCYDTLVALLAKLPEDAEVCFVGDLIDRGPKSMQVVELVKSNPRYHCVKGNHEELMVDDAKNAISFMNHWPVGRVYNAHNSTWCRNGGRETVQSYVNVEGIDHDARNEFNFEKFEEHVEWMRVLPIYLEFPELKDGRDRPLVVSHSVIRKWKNRNDPDKVGYFNETTLWGRDFSNLRDQGIYNIIGHTPQEMGHTVKDMYTNVDTGAVFKDIGFGLMTAIEFPSLKVYVQENIEVD